MRLFANGVGWLIVLAVLLPGDAWTQPQDASIAARHVDLQAVEKRTVDDARKRAHEMSEMFDRELGPFFAADRLSATSDDEAEELFQAANRVVFYAQEARHALLLQRSAAVLEARSRLTDRHRRDLYRAWVVTRRFDDANALASAHPELQLEPLPPLPAREDGGAGQSVVWRPADNARALSEHLVERDALSVVVLSHPRCGFSQRAIAAIEADPVLAVRLGDALWLAPPNGSLDLPDIQAWNRAHPGAHLSYAVAMRDWPQFDSWATPVFYFMREGKVVATVTGWPREGRARELHRAFAQMDASADP